ncbi:MAG: TonB-dependent receptor [Bacteroidales bacterium]|nr:TonB-dependent receptor [Bacteroidales bacterium]
MNVILDTRMILLTLLQLILLFPINAQKLSIHGTIRDSTTGEALIGVNVYIEGTQQGTISNNYGFYSLNLSKDSFTIIYSYVGYEPLRLGISIRKSLTLDVLLKPVSKEIKEVLVTAQKSSLLTTNTSRNELPVSLIRTMPTSTGESDVLKALQLMPGIQAANEGAANLYVRGGSYDQNLILLDEAPVYNPTHALGFFSTFNTQALKNVSIFKGAFPAQYGGRLSSVVDIAMREGNFHHLHGNATIGLIASSLTLEGPLSTEKASFIFSGRYSYAGQMLNFLGGTVGRDLLNIYELRNFNDQNKIWFYDLNAKTNFRLNDKNHFYLSSYSGQDQFYCFPLNNQNELKWSNQTFTLRWNHIFSGRWFSNFTFYHSDYRYQYTILEDIRNFLWKSNIRETGLKSDFTFFANESNTIKLGMSLVNHRFNPGIIEPANVRSIIKPFTLQTKRSWETALYASNEQKLLTWLTINYGLRFSTFMNVGPGTVFTYDENMTLPIDSFVYSKNQIINTYRNIEPRITANFKFTTTQAIKMAYAHTVQYLHLLSNSAVGLPTDLWLPPDAYLKPQHSNQYVLGYYQSINDNAFELTFETYYKTLQHIVDYRDNADLFMNRFIETQLLHGHGYSYGVECMIDKKQGNLTGWLAYTYARTQYQINGVNQNRYYSPRYDIRHNLSLIGSYQISKKWTLISTFKLTSGGYITLPERMFYVDGTTFFDYSGRNNYALPWYHRLDIAFIYRNPENDYRRIKSQWTFAIYNVYNRKNVYSLYVRPASQSSTVYMMYLFGITPTVVYQISF